MKKVNELIKKIIPNAKYIKFPEFAYADVNFIWSKHPMHYTKEMYEYYAQAIDIICGFGKFKDTLESLYKKQSMNNRLLGRLLKCSEIYEVPKLQKELVQANKRIEELEVRMDKLEKHLAEYENIVGMEK